MQRHTNTTGISMNDGKQKTHWKKLYNPNYLGAYAFQPGEDKILTIAKVVRELVQGEEGRTDECTVAHFTTAEKPMIMNRTNQKTIEKIYETPYVEDWIGKSIQVYVTKVRLKKDTVDGLRIRPEPPVQKLPPLTPRHEKWSGAVLALRVGSNNIEGIKKFFSLSQEMEAKLLDEAKGA